MGLRPRMQASGAWRATRCMHDSFIRAGASAASRREGGSERLRPRVRHYRSFWVAPVWWRMARDEGILNENVIGAKEPLQGRHAGKATTGMWQKTCRLASRESMHALLPMRSDDRVSLLFE